MHFDWYTKNKLLLNLYGRYFWYLELNRATQIIALYADDESGVLLADIKGKSKSIIHLVKSYMLNYLISYKMHL